MKSANHRNFIYEKNQLVEVICQLRFPAILSIEAKEPADFQDTVRGRFPRYSVREESLPTREGGNQKMKNHSFVSADGAWKLSLTKDFIALSTVRYPDWESFARTLDEALGNFIQVYHPAFFERVGLRYLNAFSREKLELTDCRWNDLLEPKYLGVLDDDGINEADVAKCSVDVEQKLDGRCNVKLHAGPGNIRRTVRTDKGMQTVEEPETRFILDLDVYSGKKTELTEAAATLEAIHGHADRLFSDAITDRLHEAMEPVEL